MDYFLVFFHFIAFLALANVVKKIYILNFVLGSLLTCLCYLLQKIFHFSFFISFFVVFISVKMPQTATFFIVCHKKIFLKFVSLYKLNMFIACIIFSKWNYDSLEIRVNVFDVNVVFEVHNAVFWNILWIILKRIVEWCWNFLFEFIWLKIFKWMEIFQKEVKELLFFKM